MRQTLRPMLVGLVLMGFCGPQARSAGPEAIAAAQRYLGSEARARSILFFMYPTTKLVSVAEYQQPTGVVDGTGKQLPGWFALHYRYRWQGILENGHTDQAYLFTDTGRLHSVQVARTTSTPPYLEFNLVLQVIKDELEKKISEVRDPVIRELLQTGLRTTDAKSILTGLLMLDQP